MENKLLTIIEVQQRLGISRFTIHRLTKQGKLRSLKIGKLVRYESAEIENFIASLLDKSAEQAEA